MNKNVVGIVIIVLAIALFVFYAWPKLKPYVSGPDIPAGSGGEPRPGMGSTTAPI